MKTSLYLFAVFLLLSACNLKEQKEKNNTQKKAQEKTIDDYTDTYTITPNKEHPKFKTLEAEFAKQEYRFEIETCQFKYNDQAFFIGDSPEKIIKIFGEPDENIQSFDNKVVSFSYEKMKMVIKFSLPQKKLVYFWLNMSDYNGYEDTLYNIIMFRNIPYHLDMKLNDFIALSDLSHKKLRRMSRSFFMLQKECPPDDEHRILTFIASKAAYESNGGGHLTHTGEFDPNISSRIERIEISLENLETFTKN